MNWSEFLLPEERVQWEGRPAPGCFTFRNWRHSIFGILLLLLSVYWQIVGFELRVTYQTPLVIWIPLPFVLVGLYLAVGHLLLARLEWEKVFYAVTDRRILIRRGFLRPRLETLPLSEVTFFRVKPLAEELASFRITGSQPPQTLVISCIEHPRRLTALLESALAASSRLQRKDEAAAAGAAIKGENP